MKTRRISLITFLTLMMACFCIAIFGLKVNKADAAVVETVGYKDTFDSSEYTLSDSFKKIGNAKLKEDYTALRIKTDSYEWGAHIVNNQFKMNYDDINVGDSYVLELTVNVFDAGSWFSLSFGTIDPLYEFPHASGAFIFMNNFTELFVQQSNGALNTSGKNCDVNLFGGEPKDVTVIFTKTEESHIYDLKLNNRSLGEVYIFDGYFGFNSCTTSFDVTRFEISTLKGETKTLIFDDDFTSSSILYSSMGSSDAAWNASVHWDKNSALIGYISKLDLREDGSGIIYVNPFTKSTNEDLDVIYELSADFYTEEMENADCGFIIGADEDGNGGVFAGITNDGFSCYLKVGSEIKEMNSVNTMHLTLSVYADGRIVLSDGTIHVEAYSEKVEGYFGIKTVAENGVGAVVDEFAYNVYSYIDRKNDDVKTNFNDTTTKIMFNEEVPDFYLPSKYWHLGTGVKLPLYTSKTKENGYLKLSNASEFTCFGGKTKYTDFIVRFDVKMTDNIQSGNLIGIQFAKKQLSESSTNSTFIAFQCINLNGNYTTCYLSNKCVSTRGDNNGIIENLDNIFIADKVYNFMFIVKDGTATMHVKAEDEDESVLAIPRATFTNLDTDGYVAMFANGGIYLTLDNYSVTPRDAIIIICQYGEDALLKLIVDVLDTTDSLTASIGAIISIVMDHGAEIYGEIVADPEYRELVSAIESKRAELMQLYNDLKDHPLVTAIDIDKRIAKEIGDLEILYYQLINVVTKNVRAYDEEVADILITALYDIVDEFGIFAEAGKDYLGWLEGHGSLMVGALLHSFLQNTLELGEVADEVIINYANKLAKLTKEFCTELAENIKAAVRKKVEELAAYGHELENIVTLKVIEIVDEVTEFVTSSLDDAVNGEYTPDDNSYYVAIAGNNSEYAQMLAAALGLSDRHTVMGWDNIDKNVLYGADFVTLGYDRTAVSGFAVDQFLAAVALYGDESFREQLSDYLAVALADDFSQEELELLLTNIDNAIVNALEGPVFNGKTVQDMDWAELIGEENVALVNEMLAEIEIYLEEYGIMDEWVVSINVPNLLSNYLLNIHYFDNAPVFELSLPASETVMLAVESYIYSNIAFYKEYAETIIDLVENNPDVEIAVLGQYNPFSDMTVNGISIPLGEIYGKLVTVSNIHAFAYAFVLPNVTYVDISDAETAWDSISDPSDLLNAYLENPEGDVFTDESNLYVMNQILAAYNLSCKHAYDGCTDDTCNVCGAIRNNAEHSYTSSVTEPDCVRGGYTTHTCTVCGDSYIDNRTDALGHQYDNACDAECNVCHEQRTPADHVFGEWILIVAPTGESEGREERVCSVCGEVESRVVPMLELSYNVGEIIAIVIGSGVVLFGVVAQVATFIRKRKESIVE